MFGRRATFDWSKIKKYGTITYRSSIYHNVKNRDLLTEVHFLGDQDGLFAFFAHGIVKIIINFFRQIN